jgi:hypothetical protein
MGEQPQARAQVLRPQVNYICIKGLKIYLRKMTKDFASDYFPR